MNRPETIEDTAALVDEAGGRGTAVRVDHLVPDEVRALIARIEREQGALHVLVNDIFGATRMEWNKTVWESDLEYGLHLLRLGIDTHAITSHFALPLMIKTAGCPGRRSERRNDRVQLHQLPRLVLLRSRQVGGQSHGLRTWPRAAAPQGHGGRVTPGWLRSEAMLDAYGVTESNWRDATKVQPHFAISETPAFVGRAVAALAGDPDVARWNGASLSSGQLAKVYGFTDLDGSQPDAWRYLVEVQDAGKPADVTGYR